MVDVQRVFFRIFLSGFFMLMASQVFAHGVTYRIVSGADVVSFEAAFSSGEPIAYGFVKIFAPGASDVEFQNGRTDTRGFFSFIPDRAGSWHVVVDAGMGHRLDFFVAVDKQRNIASKNERVMHAHDNRWFLAVMGISIILNLCFAFLWVKSRKV